MRRVLLALVVGMMIVPLGDFLLQHREFVLSIKEYIEGANSLSQLVYVLLLIASGIFLPFSAMPLIPFAAAIFGPLETALLSIVGWTIGACIAFLLARHYGRPTLEKYMSLSKLDALSMLLPKRNRFFAVVIFRLVLPSDIANYALGMAKSLGFVEYFLATLIVHTWYSVLLSYLGHAVLEGNNMFAVKIGLAILVIFSIGWYLLKHPKS